MNFHFFLQMIFLLSSLSISASYELGTTLKQIKTLAMLGTTVTTITANSYPVFLYLQTPDVGTYTLIKKDDDNNVVSTETLDPTQKVNYYIPFNKVELKVSVPFGTNWVFGVCGLTGCEHGLIVFP